MKPLISTHTQSNKGEEDDDDHDRLETDIVCNDANDSENIQNSFEKNGKMEDCIFYILVV